MILDSNRPRRATLMKKVAKVSDQPPFGERAQRGQMFVLSFVLHRTTAGSPAGLTTVVELKNVICEMMARRASRELRCMRGGGAQAAGAGLLRPHSRCHRKRAVCLRNS